MPYKNGYSTTGLPVIPYTLTTTIDGIKYETHVLTNTCEVITEDGVTLCEILKELVTNEQLKEAISSVGFDNPVYQYKGVLLNRPDKSAIDQLFEKVGMQDGEVYLVQTSEASTESTQPVVYMTTKDIKTLESNSANKRFDMYTWASVLNEWLYFGSTEKSSLPTNFPIDTVMQIPETIGKPGQTIMVSSNGKTLEWKFPSDSTETAIAEHNNDKNAHPTIWRELENKADKLKIFNTILPKDNWAWFGEHGYYSCIFANKNIPSHSYFEITPIIITNEQIDVVKNAKIHPVYSIEDSADGSFAIINADHVPTSDINICVKVYGDFTDI